MTSFRWLRSAVAVLWKLCSSAKTAEFCVVGCAFAFLAYGCWLVYVPLGYIVPSALILAPRFIERVRPVRPVIQQRPVAVRGAKPWAA